MLKTFSLGEICILIGIKPEKNEDPRDTSDRQGKGINQVSLMASFPFLPPTFSLYTLRYLDTRSCWKAEYVLCSALQWRRGQGTMQGKQFLET